MSTVRVRRSAVSRFARAAGGCRFRSVGRWVAVLGVAAMLGACGLDGADACGASSTPAVRYARLTACTPVQSGPPQTTAAGVPASVPATSSLPQSAPEPPTAPVLGAPTVVPKRLTLAWGEVERAATYQVQRLMPDGSWSAEGAPIPAPATSATLPIAAHLLDWK